MSYRIAKAAAPHRRDALTYDGYASPTVSVTSEPVLYGAPGQKFRKICYCHLLNDRRNLVREETVLVFNQPQKMKESLRVVTTDGIVLSATRFIPEKANGKVILINSATGVKQKYYSDFASFLANEGFYVYTYDYRGIGGSKPQSLRKFSASMKDWGIFDYPSILKNITQSHPGSRVVVVGHSVGGQLVGFSSISSRADAVVMIASQTPFWKHYPGFWMSTKLYILWYVAIPFLTWMAGYFPSSKLGLFEDLPAAVARQWARWAKSPNYIFDELPDMESKFSELQQPALMVSISDDDLAPSDAVCDLMKRYPGLKWSHWQIKPEDILQKKIGHFGFFKKRMRSTLWMETLRWINKPMELKQDKAA
jgi:predicted alpha/beta hydrolase